MRARIPVVAVTMAAVAVAFTGCSTSKPKADKCQAVSAPLTDIPTRTDFEPKLRIPVPPGWQRSTLMDSENVRYSIRAEGLAADGFTPNAVVTLQALQGKVGTPSQILELQADQLATKLNVKDMKNTSTEICGAPALSSAYTVPEVKLGPQDPTVPERKATSLATVYRTGDSAYLVTLTIQTVKPDDATYAKDSAMILTGFQLLPA